MRTFKFFKKSGNWSYCNPTILTVNTYNLTNFMGNVFFNIYSHVLFFKHYPTIYRDRVFISYLKSSLSTINNLLLVLS